MCPAKFTTLRYNITAAAINSNVENLAIKTKKQFPQILIVEALILKISAGKEWVKQYESLGFLLIVAVFLSNCLKLFLTSCN